MMIVYVMFILLVLAFIITVIQVINFSTDWFEINSKIDEILMIIFIGILVIEFILAITIIWNI